MEEKLTTEQWIKAIKALLFANQDIDESDIDIEYIKKLIDESIAESGEKGYECVETSVELTNETITGVYQSDYDYTMTHLQYVNKIVAPVITVIFDGTEYICEARGDDSYYSYGAASPTEFGTIPFSITSYDDANVVYLADSAQHTIRIMSDSNIVTTTPCFEEAVKSVIGAGATTFFVDVDYGSDAPQNPSATHSEIKQAILAGMDVALRYHIAPIEAGNLFYIIKNVQYGGDSFSDERIVFYDFYEFKQREITVTKTNTWTIQENTY